MKETPFPFIVCNPNSSLFIYFIKQTAVGPYSWSNIKLSQPKSSKFLMGLILITCYPTIISVMIHLYVVTTKSPPKALFTSINSCMFYSRFPLSQRNVNVRAKNFIESWVIWWLFASFIIIIFTFIPICPVNFRSNHHFGRFQ